MEEIFCQTIIYLNISQTDYSITRHAADLSEKPRAAEATDLLINYFIFFYTHTYTMPGGAVFTIITNDGKQDKLINATQLLNDRIAMIRSERRRANMQDTNPTLAEIEKTHILFVHSHFKPFAALGYEYTRNNPTSTNNRLGGEIQFNIQQYGDFFNDMVVHMRLGAVTAINNSYWVDDASSANSARGTELIRYVNQPGQRLFEKVRFSVNGNLLDEYDSDIVCMHEKYLINPQRKVSWDKMIGQERPCRAAYIGNPGDTFKTQAEILKGYQVPKVTQPELDLWIPLLFWFNKDPSQAIPAVSIPHGNRIISIKTAPANQLLQHVHATDPSLSASASLVQNPEIITCELFVNNIFMNSEIHDIFISRIGFSLIRVYRKQYTRLQKQNGEELLSALKWPIETLYIGFKPVENFEATNPYSCDDWNQYTQVERTTAAVPGQRDYMPLVQGFNAVSPYSGNSYETAFTGNNPGAGVVTTAQGRNILSPAAFYGVGGNAPLDSSLLFSVNGQNQSAVNVINYWSAYYGLPQMNPAAFVDPNAPTAFELNREWRMPRGIVENPAAPGTVVHAGAGAESNKIVYTTYTPVVKQFDISAHQIALYQEIPAEFFNHYVPFTYGTKGGVNSPEDCGVYMVTFNLYPNIHQPSGHINLSRAREFYLKYKSDVISSNYQVDLIIVAIGINFLLISDGSAVIRYST